MIKAALKMSLIALVALVLMFGLAYQTEWVQNTLFDAGTRKMMEQRASIFNGLRVVVCGSASPLGADPDRAQACIAVLTPEHFFIFDVGARSPLRLRQARLPLDRLDGVFLTHYHSDHIAALPDVNLASWVQGRKTGLKVYGPAGIERVVGGFNEAFALDRQYRTAHHGEVLLPAVAGPMSAEAIDAGKTVWQDESLSIQAFTVDHSPVTPAVGYRVDYRGRSVVISGDTLATDTLFEAASGADLVIHDALSRKMLERMIHVATDLEVPVIPQIMKDVMDYHADSLSLEERAKKAGIRQLAYYHLVPVPPNDLAMKLFVRGLKSETILVSDLQTFDLPPDSDAIEITYP